MGIFITPQGQENGYLYSTEDGNLSLLEQAELSRLLIVSISPGYLISGLKIVQEELSGLIQVLIQKNCANMPCPFFTDGDDLGEKAIVFENKEFLVEIWQYQKNFMYMRLIFKQNLNQIQSQVRLKINSNEKQMKKIAEILEDCQQQIVTVDEDYLDFSCYRQIFSGIFLLPVQLFANTVNVSVLGGGVGTLSKFIYHHFQNIFIETIEISKDILQIAERYFILPIDKNFQMICQDALYYINDLNEKIQSIDKYKKEIIILDINSDNPKEISPPTQFITIEFLQKIYNCLTEKGVFIVNIICYDQLILKSVLEVFSTIFESVYICKLKTDKNSTIIAQKREKILEPKDILLNFEKIVKELKTPLDSSLEISEYLKNITISVTKENSEVKKKKNKKRKR